MGWFLLVGLLSCSWFGGSSVDCVDGEQVLAQSDGTELRCEQLEPVLDLIDLIAGRPMDRARRGKVLGGARANWQAAPAASAQWLLDVQRIREEFDVLRGREAAKRRMALLHEWRSGSGVFGEESIVSSVLWKHVVIWGEDPTDQTMLTEMDVEGWLFFASLCREAQGGSPLRISIADRLTAYRMIEERYQGSSTRERQALVGIGPFWGPIRRTWKRATYEEQQSWIQIAPLPPPMTGTSLAYLEAVLEGPIVDLVETLHVQLGPLALTGRL
jgi:hypothetical protein